MSNQTCTACCPWPTDSRDWHPVQCVGGPLDGERHSYLGHGGDIGLRSGKYVLDRDVKPFYVYRWVSRVGAPTPSPEGA